jgi:hypothetical protein
VCTHKGKSENMEKLPLVYGPFWGERFYPIINFQVGTLTTLLTGNPGLFTGRARDFFFSKTSRPTSEHPQPSIQVELAVSC